jgi:N-acetylneuraminic acid mutarotase
MKMRLSRGISLAIAMGLTLSGGAALAAGTHGSSPSVAIKWKAGKDFPSTATRFDGAVVGGKVYFLGFRVDDAGTTDGSIWSYDIKKGKYTDTKTDMPVPISNYAIAVLKDSKGVGLYTFGGRDANGKILTTVQVYYPATNKAMVVKTDPWPGKTPSKCVSLPATGVSVVNNTAYVVGGDSFSTSVPPCTDDNSKQVWSFDPMGKSGKKWKAQPALNVARGYIATATIGSTIYAVGGNVNAAGTLTADPTVESWKIGTKKWDDKGVANLPEGCDESQAFAFAKGSLGGTVTLTGCGQWPNALGDVLQYNVKSNKWSNDGSLKEARRNQAGVNIGSDTKPVLMVVGGYNSDGTVILASSEIGTPGKAQGVAPGVFAPRSIAGSRASAF